MNIRVGTYEHDNAALRRESARRGFTIVELLIVVVVIAILAAITIVAYNGIQNKAKISAAQSAVSQAVKKVQIYAVQNADSYPATAQDAGLTSANGTTYEVASNNAVSPKGFCVTVTTGGLTYFQTNAMASSAPGTCIGMLAWWPFNGDAKDKSGNGIDATVSGASLTNGVNGSANGAYQLGDTAQYINVGSPASFSTVPSAFTYSIWVARTGTSTTQWPMVMGASDTHRDFGIRTNSFGASAYFEWGLSPYDGSTFTGSGSTGSLSNLNEWHHAVVTFDGSTILMYWDGALKYTRTSMTLRPTMASFSIGTSSSGLAGKVDDARVYNRALSASEVRAMFDGGAQ